MSGARGEFLPFAQPAIEEPEIEAVVDVLRSGWLTTGPKVGIFEHAFAAEVGSDTALATNSGTAAMHVALKTLGVAPGTSIITTPMTFCSTAHVIEQVGCFPVFVDVQRDTLNIDPAAIRDVLDSQPGSVGAILVVHYGGHPVELDRILEIGRHYGIPIVEDAAHAFGAQYRGTPIGQVRTDDHRRAVCFSLYATKNITTGEGGMLTGSPAFVEHARPWSLHGMTRDAWNRYGSTGSWAYDVTVPGFKYNMSDVQAALGLVQLRRWQAFQKRRTEIALCYTAQFADMDEIDTPHQRDDVEHAWHLYPIRLRLDLLTLDRAEFIHQLRARNIGSSVHFIPVPFLSYYQERYGIYDEDIPVTAAEFDRLVSLPIYPRMSDGDVHDVVAAVRDIVAGNRRRRT